MPTKIGGPFETAKRNLLKDVKGFEKVVYRDGDVQIIVAFGFAQLGGKAEVIDEFVEAFLVEVAKWDFFAEPFEVRLEGFVHLGGFQRLYSELMLFFQEYPALEPQGR